MTRHGRHHRDTPAGDQPDYAESSFDPGHTAVPDDSHMDSESDGVFEESLDPGEMGPMADGMDAGDE